jgi:hypothetical protein
MIGLIGRQNFLLSDVCESDKRGATWIRVRLQCVRIYAQQFQITHTRNFFHQSATYAICERGDWMRRCAAYIWHNHLQVWWSAVCEPLYSVHVSCSRWAEAAEIFEHYAYVISRIISPRRRERERDASYRIRCWSMLITWMLRDNIFANILANKLK